MLLEGKSMTTIGATAIGLILAVAGALVLIWPDVSVSQEKHKVTWSSRPENTKFTVNHARTGTVLGIKGIARYSGFNEVSAAGVITKNEVSAEAEYSIEK